MSWKAFWAVIGMFIGGVLFIALIASYIEWIAIHINNPLLSLFAILTPFVLMFATVVGVLEGKYGDEDYYTYEAHVGVKLSGKEEGK